MYSPMRRMARYSARLSTQRIALAAFTVVAGLVVGCDDLSLTGKEARVDINKGIAAYSSKSDDSLAVAEKSLQDAVTKSKNSANAISAEANGALGGVKYDQAQARFAELRSAQTKVSNTLTRINSVLLQISGRKQIASGYAKQDPTNVLATLKQNSDSIKGNGQDGKWKTPNEDVSLPTLSATKQSISALEDQITSLKQQIETLGSQRVSAISETDKQLKISESAQGAASVDAFNLASVSRRKAEDLHLDIDLLTDKQTKLEADLTSAKALDGALTKAVDSLQEHSSTIKAGWDDTSKQITAQKSAANDLVKGASSKETIDLLGAQLEAQLKDVSSIHDLLQADLQSAEKYFSDAQAAASMFTKEVSSIEYKGQAKEDWKKYLSTLHQNVFQHRLGIVQREQGNLSSLEAQQLSQILSTKTILTEVLGTETRGTVPAVLTSEDYRKQFDDAVKSADERYDIARTSFLNVETGDTPEPVKRAAKADRLLTIASVIQHRQMAMANGVTYTGDAVPGLILKNEGIVLRDEMRTSAIPIPQVPGVLGDAGTIIQPPASTTPPAEGSSPTDGSTPKPTTTDGTTPTPTEGTTPTTPPTTTPTDGTTTPTPAPAEGTTPVAPPAEPGVTTPVAPPVAPSDNK